VGAIIWEDLCCGGDDSAWMVGTSEATRLLAKNSAFHEQPIRTQLATPGFEAVPARKKAPESSGARGTREMRSSESVKLLKTYLLSAIGLAPKSRRLLTAVRAARTLGMLAAAAP